MWSDPTRSQNRHILIFFHVRSNEIIDPNLQLPSKSIEITDPLVGSSCLWSPSHVSFQFNSLTLTLTHISARAEHRRRAESGRRYAAAELSTHLVRAGMHVHAVVFVRGSRVDDNAPAEVPHQTGARRPHSHRERHSGRTACRQHAASRRAGGRPHRAPTHRTLSRFRRSGDDTGWRSTDGGGPVHSAAEGRTG